MRTFTHRSIHADLPFPRESVAIKTLHPPGARLPRPSWRIGLCPSAAEANHTVFYDYCLLSSFSSPPFLAPSRRRDVPMHRVVSLDCATGAIDDTAASHRLFRKRRFERPQLLAFSNDSEMNFWTVRGYWLCEQIDIMSLHGTGFSRYDSVGNQYLASTRDTLTVLDCTGLSQLATIGDEWLAACHGITTLDCAGLTQLAAVGAHWLAHSTGLKGLDCTGLARLVTVGDFWLNDCTSLTALDCTGLTQLASVGDRWLYGCTALTALDCTELTQLTTVGDCWLANCTSLTVLDCTPMTQLRTVGDDWLRGCASLTTLNCTGLAQLTTIGDGWLLGCSSLTAVDADASL